MANIRRNIDSLVWVILGIILCFKSVQIGLGTLQRPGPGLVAFLIGGSLGLLGSILLIQNAIKPRQDNTSNIRISVTKFQRERLYFTFGILAYALVLDIIGFILATSLLLFFTSKVMHPRRWFVPIIFSIISIALSYLLFHVWLGIRFPKGLFGLG